MSRTAHAARVCLGLLVAVSCFLHHHGPTAGEVTDVSPKVAVRAKGPTRVVAGRGLEARVEVEDFVLLPPPPGRDAMRNEGHYHVYLDKVAGTPLVDGADPHLALVMPEATPPGQHELIVVLAQHDEALFDAQARLTVTVDPAPPWVAECRPPSTGLAGTCSAGDYRTVVSSP